MELLSRMRERYKELHPICRYSVKIGAGLALCYLLTGLFAYYIAPYTKGYFRSMLIFREAVKASVASLLVTVLLLVIGDWMLSKRD